MNRVLAVGGVIIVLVLASGLAQAKINSAEGTWKLNTCAFSLVHPPGFTRGFDRLADSLRSKRCQ